MALHDNPAIENNKAKPIHSLEERKEILLSIKYVDEVITYKYESDFEMILSTGNFNKRFLGDDYKDKDFTGKSLNIPIVFINRDHGYSTTKLKKMIRNS